MKIPVGIPVFVAAAGTDPRFAKMVTRWLLSAGVWLLFASAVGLLEAFRLVDPKILSETAVLTYARMRPVHTMTMLFGWASMALVGLSFYVICKSAWVPMNKPLSKLELLGANAAVWLTNLGVFGGVIALATGHINAGREYREYPWYCMAPVFLAIGIVGWIFYRVVARRNVKGIYISCWFIISACFWVAITVLMGYQTFFVSGLADRVIDGFYIHNAVGMWFTPVCVGLTYYALPKLLNKPIYSYALGVLGFFTHFIFYTVIGTHHYIFSPLPQALQTTAVIFSVAMIVPVWASTGNFLLTMRGERLAISHSYSLPFLLTGVLGYGLSSLQGSAESLRIVQENLHFTHYTVGHAHLAMYMFVTFLIWGCIYGLVPRMTGREPPVLLVSVQFWLALSGIAVYVVGLCAGGHIQGNAWVDGKPFMDSVTETLPYMVWRSVGGMLMAVSHVLFFVALWKMRPGAFTMAFGSGGSN